jgi:hypothetical protein
MSRPIESSDLEVDESVELVGDPIDPQDLFAPVQETPRWLTPFLAFSAVAWLLLMAVVSLILGSAMPVLAGWGVSGPVLGSICTYYYARKPR